MVDNLDFAEIQALSQQPVRFVALSDDSAALIMALAAFYQRRFNWLVDGNPPTDAEWNNIRRLIGKMEYELMNSLVGLIFPHGLGTIAGMPFLPCDGTIYNRTDYPILYSKLDPVYIIDADTFRVPDMRDRVPVGAGTDFGIDDTGGEKEHTLTLDEMPVHTHTEVSAVATVINGGLEAPASSAVPATTTTGAAGGGEPHNNMPPYVGVYWAIIAG